MIGYLKGKIIDVSETSAVILCGQVGYEIFLTTNELLSLKKEHELEYFIYTHVREDILALYGFKTKDELELFKLLLSVSGIGPKVALSIVGSFGIDKLKASISAGDPNLLSSVSGVGKKTAEKAVIELKSKIGPTGIFKSNYQPGTDEVYDALSSLGFGRTEIAEALTKIPSEIESSEEKIKEALKIIGKRK